MSSVALVLLHQNEFSLPGFAALLLFSSTPALSNSLRLALQPTLKYIRRFN